MTETIQIVRKLVRNEQGTNIDYVKFGAFMLSAEYWMNKGYSLAQQRYKNPHKTVNLFRDIEREVDKLLKHAEQGEEIHISYSIRKAASYIELKTLADLNPDPYAD